MPKPALSTVPEWYHKYVNLVQFDNVKEAIASNTKTSLSFFESIPDSKWTFRYAAGKWSIKEMVQHIIDAERIFAYRALCFARRDKTPLPGFDENEYATAAYGADNRTKQDLLEEIKTVRKSIEQLFASFSESDLASVGTANNNPVSVNAIGFIIPGHMQHHINVLQERYLA